MKYIDFREAMKIYPVFSIREIEKRFPGFDNRRLNEWQKKGYIQKLRNQYYCFTDRVTEEPALYYAANTIYRPSYVSLETALAWYGFIPEGVFQVVSCTTRKTQSFETPRGRFLYRHLKESLYFGYRLEQWKAHYFLIADAEKTLIDYLYLHPDVQEVLDIEGLRWNAIAINEQVSMKKLEAYDASINIPALSRRMALLKEFLHARVK